MIEQSSIPVVPDCPLCRGQAPTQRPCDYCAESAMLAAMDAYVVAHTGETEMIEQSSIPVSPNCPLCRVQPTSRRECGYCAEEATLSNMETARTTTGATKMIDQQNPTCASCHQVIVSEPGDTCADIPQWQRGAFTYCDEAEANDTAHVCGRIPCELCPPGWGNNQNEEGN